MEVTKPPKPSMQRVASATPRDLVDLLRSLARNSRRVFGKAFPHLLVTPRSLERVGVEQVVLRPGDADVIDELLTILPRCATQVAMTEGSNQQLRFIQPRGVSWREPWSPPARGAAGALPEAARQGLGGLSNDRL